MFVELLDQEKPNDMPALYLKNYPVKTHILRQVPKFKDINEMRVLERANAKERKNDATGVTDAVRDILKICLG